MVSCNKLSCRTLHQYLLVTCQQPLISSFPVSSPTLVQPEPENSAMVAGVVAALVVALIVIIIVVVIAYFLYK